MESSKQPKSDRRGSNEQGGRGSREKKRSTFRSRSSAKSFDEAEQLPEITGWRQWTAVFVESNAFQSIMAVVILANAVLIGLETDMPEWEWLWDIFENIFLCIFTAELCLRLYYLQGRFFLSADRYGNWFDLLLVVCGLVDFALTEVLRANTGNFGLLMKALRLLRILRLFRLFKMFKELYILASGFLESFSAVFWVSLLCALLLYICAICLTRTLGNKHGRCSSDIDVDQYCKNHFGTVARSMFTLFELMANPELTEVRPIMLSNPAMMLFFVIFIIYGSFAMLSILTGVISESMVQRGNDHREAMRFEKERKKAALMERLNMFFTESDTDGDGTMTREEFVEHIPQMIKMFQTQGFAYEQQDLEMVFDLVDFDKGGTIEVDEFLIGMISFSSNVSDLPLQFLRLQSNVNFSTKDLQESLEGRFDAVDKKLRALDAKVNVISLKEPAGAAVAASQAKSGFGFWC